MLATMMEHHKSRLNEEARFINSLDILTAEDKIVMTDQDSPRYYQTDGNYSVQHIEIMD